MDINMRKIISVIAGLVLALNLTGCGSNAEPVTAEEFTAKMTEKGYQVVDATDKMEEGYVESVTVALKDDFQIEFFVLPSSEQALNAYYENKAKFEEQKSTISANVNFNVGKVSNYRLSTDDGYFVVSRIDNTFIYAAVEKKHKEEVSKIIKELGY